MSEGTFYDDAALLLYFFVFYAYNVCIEVLRPSQPNGVMSSAVNFYLTTRLLGRLSPLSYK